MSDERQFESEDLRLEVERLLAPRSKNAMDLFDRFSVDQWCEWFRAFLSYQPTDPDLSVGMSEPHHALLRLYESLKSNAAKDKFASGVAQVFETTLPADQNAAEKLFYLIHMISYLVPYQAKRIVRIRLFDHILDGVEYGNRNLQMMLLAACAEYDFDDELAYFIQCSSEKEKDFTRMLLYFRLMSRRSGREAWMLLERLLPELEDGQKCSQLERVLGEVVDRVGYKSLLEWYAGSVDRLTSEFPEKTALLSNLFRKLLPLDYTGRDPYVVLLSGAVVVSNDVYHSDYVVRVARLAPVAGNTLVTKVLEMIQDSDTKGWAWGLIYDDEAVLQTHIGEYAVVDSAGRKVYLDPSRAEDLGVVRILQATLERSRKDEIGLVA